LAGTADVALIDLDTLKDRKFDGGPLLASFFTRPFLFSDVYQAYFVQEAALGSAALSDISRTGLVALGYWNRGESQLVTKKALPTVDAIKELKIGYDRREDAALVFSKLGASSQALRPENVLDAFDTGTVNAAVVNQPTEKFFRQMGPTFVVPIRPLVGILVANAGYWRQLKETEKRAWQRTVSSADMSAKIEVQARAKYISTLVTFEQIPLPRDKTKAEILSTGLSDESYVSYQLDLVNGALNAGTVAQAPIQKKN
jgi:TRAP-type C4-dicarboxylate transport system substrate-binding protein